MSSSTDPHIPEALAGIGDRNEDHGLESYVSTPTPINKLPPELIAHIFLIAATHGEPSGSWYPTHFSNSWISITCVCRQWREIAMHTSSLWTVINPTHLEWTKLLLERSKSSPLTLFTPELSKTNSDAYALAFQHIHRFSSVVMQPTRSSSGRARVLEQQTLPFLRHIIFKSPDGHSGNLMPDIFDQCHLPALESLTLAHYKVNPSSPIFTRTLTDLSIFGATGFTAPVIVEILSKTPALVSLSLHGDGDFEPPPKIVLSPVAESQRISLPCLEHCSLALFGNGMTKTVALLNHLSFPSSAMLDIAIWPPDDDPMKLFGQGLVPTLTGDNRIGPMPQYRTCFVDFPNMSLHLSRDLYLAQNEIMFGDVDDDDSSYDTLPTAQYGFSIRALIALPGSHPARWTPRLFEVLHQCTLAIESIESLVINDEQCEGHPAGWYTILSKMPNLSQVQVNLRSYKDLSPSSLQVFLSNVLLFSDGHEGKSEDEGEDEDEAGGVNSQEPFLPHLKTFALSKKVFRPSLVNVLLDLLGKRKARGAVIETLVIRGRKKWRAEDLERLREVVEDVTWVKY